MGGNIEVVSGVSWLHDKLREIMTERMEFLKEGIADGVPQDDYRCMVGRYKEAKRFVGITLPELFTEFYQSSDEGESDELEEISDD